MKWQPADETAVEQTAPAEPQRPPREQAQIDEAWCRDGRDFLMQLARNMAQGREDRDAKDRVGYSTVAKICDTALKFHRAAMDERMKRGDEDFAAWLVEEKRRLLNRGAH